MKILLVNKYFYLKGGAEAVFFSERDFLKKLTHEVIDFSMTDERNIPSQYADLFVSNINFDTRKGVLSTIQQAFSFVHSSMAVKNIEKLIIQEQPQIAHLHNIYHQLTPSIISVLRKHGVKIVMTLHDCKLVCPSYLALKGGKICNSCAEGKFWNAFISNCQHSRIRSFLLSAEAIFHKWKGSYDGVDIFLTPSRFLAHLSEQRISSGKLIVLPNGIDVEKYKPNFSDHGYGLYCGRISKEKGVTTLLRAYQNQLTKLPLKIVGTGPLRDQLQREFPDVTFLGYQRGNRLENLIANSAFVVVPSEWYENCSMVILEAMAFGKTVIGSRIGGIPEQIEDGKTGFLFEVGNVQELSNRMDGVSCDRKLRSSIGKAARQKIIAEYTLLKHCNDLFRIYQQLLDR